MLIKSLDSFKSFKMSRRVTKERSSRSFQLRVMSLERTVQTTQVGLVCWLSQKRLGTNQCSITPLIVANIIKALGTNKRFNDGLYIKARIQVAGEVAKTPAIFGRYTFDEKQTQFLMYPFDYFALDIVVDFRVNADCIDDFVVGILDECNDT